MSWPDVIVKLIPRRSKYFFKTDGTVIKYTFFQNILYALFIDLLS